jgi:hypothetical protein
MFASKWVASVHWPLCVHALCWPATRTADAHKRKATPPHASCHNTHARPCARRTAPAREVGTTNRCGERRYAHSTRRTSYTGRRHCHSATAGGPRHAATTPVACDGMRGRRKAMTHGDRPKNINRTLRQLYAVACRSSYEAAGSFFGAVFTWPHYKGHVHVSAHPCHPLGN